MKKFIDKRSFESGDEKAWGALRAKYLRKIDSVSVADSPNLYMDRRLFAQTIAKIKIFEMSKNVQGSIIECGVHRGNSLMLFMHLCSVYSPVSFNKKIIGFDSFEGFADISAEDPDGIWLWDMGVVSYQELAEWISIQQRNNLIPHVDRIELVKGLAQETIPQYLDENPHLIISLLYLDFDLYRPTLLALEKLFPLMPKGAVIAFDQLNQKKWHGETLAMKEFFNTNQLELKVFDFEPHISYAIVGG
jgi:hypothetical protein